MLAFVCNPNACLTHNACRFYNGFQSHGIRIPRVDRGDMLLFLRNGPGRTQHPDMPPAWVDWGVGDAVDDEGTCVHDSSNGLSCVHIISCDVPQMVTIQTAPPRSGYPMKRRHTCRFCTFKKMLMAGYVAVAAQTRI